MKSNEQFRSCASSSSAASGESSEICASWIKSLRDSSRELQIGIIATAIEDNVIHELELFGEKAGRARLSVQHLPTNERIKQVGRSNRKRCLRQLAPFQLGRGDRNSEA